MHLIVLIISGSFTLLSFVPAKAKLVSGAACAMAVLGFVVRYFGFTSTGDFIGLLAAIVFAVNAAQTIIHITREGL
jgi:hypothetical protein